MSRVATLVGRGRAAAERLMVDTCIIDRRSGSVLDEDTGQYVDTYTTVYSGKCRIQVTDPGGRAADAGEQTSQIQSLVLQVPMTVSGVKVDDRVSLTASALDPDLVGRTFRVSDLMHKTHATARRLPVEEVAT